MTWIFYIIILIVILWIYSKQFASITCKEKIFNDDLIASGLLKTGDMIVFKAYNNFNSIFHGSYFGHVGIVWIDPLDKTATPYLFEANGIERVPLKKHHSPHGIYLTPLKDRVAKYKGKAFWKSLDKPLSADVIKDFGDFIEFCMGYMSYDYDVIKSGAKKGFGLERCGLGTNCGEITYLCLIKLGLLPLEYYDYSIFNHLIWVCDVYKLHNNHYNELVEIIDHPFVN